MKLCEILNEGSILLPVKSTQQNDVIQELLNHLQKMGYLSTTAKLYTDMETREKKPIHRNWARRVIPPLHIHSFDS